MMPLLGHIYYIGSWNLAPFLLVMISGFQCPSKWATRCRGLSDKRQSRLCSMKFLGPSPKSNCGIVLWWVSVYQRYFCSRI